MINFLVQRATGTLKPEGDKGKNRQDTQSIWNSCATKNFKMSIFPTSLPKSSCRKLLKCGKWVLLAPQRSMVAEWIFSKVPDFCGPKIEFSTWQGLSFPPLPFLFQNLGSQFVVTLCDVATTWSDCHTKRKGKEKQRKAFQLPVSIHLHPCPVRIWDVSPAESLAYLHCMWVTLSSFF